MMIEKLISYISDRNVMQAKYLQKVMLQITSDEKQEFENYLKYMLQIYEISFLAESYLLFVDDTLKETKYFVENNFEKYRYSSYEEVANLVYNDENYMNRYMIGLQLSSYLWINHLKAHRIFKNFLDKFSGNRYLEVGPGHGYYFVEAVKKGGYKEYTAIDISKTSIEMTRSYVQDYDDLDMGKLHFIHNDFLKSYVKDKYDSIVMSEVLEHVEDPAAFLQKAYDLLDDKGKIFLNVPINAPEIDHIYLFRSVEEVYEVVDSVGFAVLSDYIATANDVDYEKALRKKRPFNLILILEKHI